MTLAASYSPAFLAADGGSPAEAFEALLAGVSTGQAYLDVHSTAVTGG